MVLVDLVKENPLKTVGAVVSLVATLVTTSFAIDERYAKADELTVFKTEQSQAIQQQGIDNKRSIDMLRKNLIEDKVFEILLIPESKRSQVDRARLDKYNKDLQEIQNRWK